MSTIRGCNEAVAQVGRIEHRRGEGDTFTEPFEGPTDQVFARYWALRNSGAYAHVMIYPITPATARVEAIRYSSLGNEANDAQVIWEFLPNESTRDIYQHPIWFTGGRTQEAATEAVAKVKDEVSKKEADAGHTMDLTGNDLSMARLILQDVTGTIDYAPLIQKTLVVGYAYAQSVAFTNVRKVIPHSVIRETEDIPNDFRIPYDGDIGLPDEVDGLTIGWFKGMPSTRRLDGFKYEIVQQWRFGQWANLLYDVLS